MTGAAGGGGDVWADLEREPGGTGTVQRRLHPGSSHDLHAVLDLDTRARTVRYERPWDGCTPPPGSRSRAVQVDATPVTGARLRVDVTLLDPDFTDVFTTLAADVTAAAAAGTTPEEATDALFNRLEHWRELLERLRDDGLDPRQRRGLFGELHVLRTAVLPRLTPLAAVQSWTGPLAANQDIQLPGLAVETKTSSGQQPQALVVTNERELDATGTGRLLLVHLSLDERRGGSGASLNDAVDATAALLAGNTSAATLFRELLTRVGYLTGQRDLYDEPRYELRTSSCYEVTDGFPRITEAMLPHGVGAVRYSISLAACQPWSVDPGELDRAVTAAGTQGPPA